MLFDAFTSNNTKAIINRFKPLRCAPWWHFSGCELRKLVAFCFVILLCAVYYRFETLKMVGHMENVWHALCDPPLDWTYGLDSLGFVHMEASTPDIRSGQITTKAVKEVLGQTDGTSPQSSYSLKIPVLRVKDAVAMTLSESVDFHNPTCEDLLGVRSGMFALYARERFGKETCSELLSLCSAFGAGRKDGTLVRALCPETCGCNRPNSSLPVFAPRFGCPSSCKDSNAWYEVRARATCFNPTVNYLNQTSYWPRWMEYARTYQKGPVPSALARYGCDFETGLGNRARSGGDGVKSQLCKGKTDAGLKPIAIACPQTCGCSDTSPNDNCGDGPVNC